MPEASSYSESLSGMECLKAWLFFDMK